MGRAYGERAEIDSHVIGINFVKKGDDATSGCWLFQRRGCPVCLLVRFDMRPVSKYRWSIHLFRRLPSCHRHASSTSAAPSLEVFNNRVKQLQRERSVIEVEASRKVEYLRDEVAARLCERLLVCN